MYVVERGHRAVAGVVRLGQGLELDDRVLCTPSTFDGTHVLRISVHGCNVPDKVDAVHIRSVMAARSDRPKRETYRHGNLRNALIEAGLELARDAGPDAVVLREATRSAGVVPNAAYRHFSDRRALLAAVSQRALAELAVALESDLARMVSESDSMAAAQAARLRLRVVVSAYVRFARNEPGLFRTAFSTTDIQNTGEPEATGSGGRTAFQLLEAALDELVETGVLAADRRVGAEFFVWSAVHGFAVLLIDGPLRGLLPVEIEEAEQRILESIERGL